MATLYLNPAGGNLNGANWGTVSGTPGSITPTAADDCILDGNGGNGTVNTGFVCRSLTINGYTGTLTHTAGVTGTIGDGTAGTSNYALNVVTTGWTYTLGNTATSAWNFVSTSATQQTIKTNTKVFGNITINGAGSSYLLGSALTAKAATFTLTAGTFNTGNFNMDVGTFSGSGSTTRSFIAGTSTISVYTANGTLFTFNTITNLTFSGTSATFVIASTSTTDRTFAGGGLTYGTLSYTIANSSGRLIILGANTFGTLNVSSARILRMPASATNNVTTFNVNGANNLASNGYVYMPGDLYGASVPDSAALSITGDFGFRVRVALDNYSLSGAQRIAGKYLTTGNQRTWRLYNTAGTLTLDMSTTGADSSTANASVTLGSLGFSNDTTYWLAFTRTQSTGAVKFYYAADSTTVPTSWTQIGTTRTATTSALFDSTALLTIGGEQVGTNSNPGKYYWAQLSNNDLNDGTGLQADIKFANKTWGVDTFTEASGNAATVTMNGLSVYGDGAVYLHSSSAGTPSTLSKSSGIVSCDYLRIQDSTATGGAAWYAGANSISVSGNTGWIFTAPPNNWTLSLSDSTTPSDAISKAVTQFSIDSVSTSDAAFRAIGHLINDSITSTDALIKNITKAFGDISSAGDNFTYTIGSGPIGLTKSIADAVVSSDAIIIRLNGQRIWYVRSGNAWYQNAPSSWYNDNNTPWEEPNV